MKNPIICAIDTTETEKAKSLAQSVSPSVGMIKLGLEFFCSNGTEGVKEVQKSGLPVFLDLKFYDIPNTVAGALKGIANLNCAMTTIHLLSGSDVLKKAVDTVKIFKNPPLLIGVTVLTSIDDVTELGFEHSISDEVFKLTELAVKCGLDGIVCSAHEIKRVKYNFGNSLKLVVPGIRPENSSNDDQKRVKTPKDAIKDGADYLVIGRPITQSDNPAKTSEEILNSIKS
jgi:orotidine-5'-phosphate decarboxylase